MKWNNGSRIQDTRLAGAAAESAEEEISERVKTDDICNRPGRNMNAARCRAAFRWLFDDAKGYFT
jgi:hypothetical protein